MTDKEFIEDMRTYRLDHLPDGYPAIQTQQIDRLIKIIDQQRKELLTLGEAVLKLDEYVDYENTPLRVEAKCKAAIELARSIKEDV